MFINMYLSGKYEHHNQYVFEGEIWTSQVRMVDIYSFVAELMNFPTYLVFKYFFTRWSLKIFAIIPFHSFWSFQRSGSCEKEDEKLHKVLQNCQNNPPLKELASLGGIILSSCYLVELCFGFIISKVARTVPARNADLSLVWIPEIVWTYRNIFTWY